MPRSVLVIEDEPEIANLVKLHLKDLNCHVKTAFDGIVGLAEAEAKSYDLIRPYAAGHRRAGGVPQNPIQVHLYAHSHANRQDQRDRPGAGARAGG